ncbi:MAG: glycosyltransferase [Lentisphaerae bacterium]|nr:glycosyltransferase [Lentisphaerota bacterium]
MRVSFSGISVVVPVYNSAESLPPLADRLQAVLTALATPYEIILVNDGSADASWSTIESLSKAHADIIGMNLLRNFGQHNALLCGIRRARFDKTITIDDDLQHAPEDIPRLLQTLEAGYDVVYGSPEREKHGLLRDMASRITKLVLQKSMGTETARQISAFRAIRTHIRESFSSYNNAFVSIDVLLTWGTRRFTAIRVHHAERAMGQSNYTVGKLVVHALNMITGFSTLPLQLASLTGFAFTLFGVFALIFVLVRYMMAGGVVPGFAFLASVIIIFSGAQLFALGIMGEYIARIHSGITKRPMYVVSQTTDEVKA